MLKLLNITFQKALKNENRMNEIYQNKKVKKSKYYLTKFCVDFVQNL